MVGKEFSIELHEFRIHSRQGNIILILTIFMNGWIFRLASEVLVHWKQFVPLNELNNCPCILKFQPIAVDLSLIHKHLSTKYTAHLSHAYVICKYHIFTYMYICVRIPFLEQRCALLSRCATQFLPTFDCLYKTLCFCCLLSLSLPYFLCNFNFFGIAWFLFTFTLGLSWQCQRHRHGLLIVYHSRLALTTRRMSNELCETRQDTRCTRVYTSLLGLASLPSLPQICMRPFCLSL